MNLLEEFLVHLLISGVKRSATCADKNLNMSEVMKSSDTKSSGNNVDVRNVENGNKKVLKIFVGYDPREDLAYEVCRYSLLKRSSIPIEVHPIKQSELREKGLYWRERGKFESTEFSFSRFLTPHLAGFDGWAMFVDCDFLYLGDIKELTELIDDKYAIMCVQHDYTPKETTKMDGAVAKLVSRRIGHQWCCTIVVTRRIRFLHLMLLILRPGRFCIGSSGWRMMRLGRFLLCQELQQFGHNKVGRRRSKDFEADPTGTVV
ncbi:hypothetical protein Leryth_003093 [Lithospermum erythrorhizon]|nr:hypothetical protein Leryth_003093 [Lithospermum erythrorhizon]